MSGHTCILCDKPAARLCDELIGSGIAGHARTGNVGDNTFYAYTGLGAPLWTCDAPLCDSHAIFDGAVFNCNRGRGKDKGCTHDTRDRCPGDHPKPVPMTDAEARIVRRQIHAGLRRLAMKGETA